MDVLLEIIKITVPALVVFITVYFLIKKFFEGQLALQQFKRAKRKTKESLPLKLQAYERLMLYCERIKISNLLLRLNVADSKAKELANAMIVAIHQEYEHNMAQQIYVSEKLWEIINTAKNQTIGIITEAKSRAGDGAGNSLMEYCGDVINSLGADPLESAKKAIKEEVGIILN